MRILAIVLLIVLTSCQSEVDKPANLISQDKMIDMFYDLAIMDAMRSHNPLSLEVRGIQPDDYVYKKYKVDSLQFATSNKYYASDIDKYKSMYAEVSKRLKAKTSEIDIELKKDPKASELEIVAPVENQKEGGFMR